MHYVLKGLKEFIILLLKVVSFHVRRVLQVIQVLFLLFPRILGFVKLGLEGEGIMDGRGGEGIMEGRGWDGMGLDNIIFNINVNFNEVLISTLALKTFLRWIFSLRWYCLISMNLFWWFL